MASQARCPGAHLCRVGDVSELQRALWRRALRALWRRALFPPPCSASSGADSWACAHNDMWSNFPRTSWNRFRVQVRKGGAAWVIAAPHLPPLLPHFRQQLPNLALRGGRPRRLRRRGVGARRRGRVAAMTAKFLALAADLGQELLHLADSPRLLCAVLAPTSLELRPKGGVGRFCSRLCHHTRRSV